MLIDPWVAHFDWCHTESYFLPDLGPRWNCTSFPSAETVTQPGRHLPFFAAHAYIDAKTVKSFLTYLFVP